MRQRMLRMVVIAAAVAVAWGARPAAAEPINILGGVIVYSRSNQAAFDLTLIDGWMQGDFGDEGGESWTPAHACFSCTPRSTVDVSIQESFGPHRGDVGVGGMLSFRGASYFIRNLDFTIAADPLRLPGDFEPHGNLSTAVSSSEQFGLHGLVQAWTADRFSGVGLGLVGYGKARMTFLPDGSWFSTTYTFENPAAVPEPASMLLFGTGIAAIAARARRRARSITP